MTKQARVASLTCFILKSTIFYLKTNQFMKQINDFFSEISCFGSSGILTLKVKRITFLWIIALQIFSVQLTFAQSARLSLDLQDVSVVEALRTIEDRTDYFFVYNNESFDLQRKVTLTVSDQRIEDVLNRIFTGTNVSYRISDQHIVLTTLKPEIQRKTITGQIKDAYGDPIPGVTVIIKGSTTGAISNLDGNFSLDNVSPDDRLVFSFIGMKSEELSVGSRSVFNIVLHEDSFGVDEVVVVGYGTQKKVNLTGAVANIRVDDAISSRTLSSVSAGLSGLLPGLAISQNSGMAGRNDVSLLVRGVGSVNNTNPLIVVDGMPDVDINRLNMNDIESVSVLKDASSSAVYGSRAANGVILITTKTGRGMKETRFNVSSSYALSTPANSLSFMADYPRALTLHNQAASAHVLPQNLLFRDGTIDQWMALGMIDPFRYPNTDWWDIILRNGKVVRHNVSAQGGTDKSNFYVSVGVMEETGLQIGNDYSRYNARFNYDYALRHNMNIGTRFGGSWSNYTYALSQGYTSGGGGDLTYAIAGITPFDPETGYFGGVMAYNESSQAFNPYTRYMNDITKAERQEINPGVFWDWTPVNGLTARLDYALNYYHQFTKNAPIPNRAYNFQTEEFGARVYVHQNAGASNTMNNGYKANFTSRVNYDTILKGNHDIGLLFVYSNEYWHDRTLSGSRNDRLHPTLTEIDAALTEVQTASGGLTTEGLESYIGRLNYVGFDKYLFEANFRYDGSSRFAQGRQYSFFPSASLGWIFTRESFVSSITDRFMTSGKFRFSYGGLGNNSGVGRYEQKETLETNNYIIDGNIVRGFVNSKMINLDLSWETTSVLNMGLDMAFLNNRLTTEFDYYDRHTVDMLRPSEMSLHLTGAYRAPRQNIGELRNRGVEANITWRDKVNELRYTVNFNVSHNKNRLEKWNEYLGRGTTFINMPLGFVYSYMDTGVAQTWQDIYNATPQDARPGDLLRLDVNGDGQITAEDRVAYPEYTSARPNTHFGLNSTLNWKGFDLGMLIQGSAGRKDFWLNDYNQIRMDEARYAFSWNHWNNPWTYDNREGIWPRMVQSNISDAGNNRVSSTFWLDDMSFVRLKNVQLGYTFTQAQIRRFGVHSIRIYGSGENLFTITKFRGLDPEKQGSSNDAYPLLRSFTFGINVSI